jgi:hypothetical protein
VRLYHLPHPKSLDAESCHKPKFVVFIRNGRITITLSGDRRKGAARSLFCNLMREWRSLEKGLRIFLFESALTH